jgi:hypothetical protein
MNDFFSSFQPWDQLLGPGQVCFYLIEKMKHQKDFLDSQEKCKIKFNCLAIDSKNDMAEEGNNKANNFGGNDLDNCITLIKNNKILKGIDVSNSLKIGF